ncbi:MAG: hypothetical protein GXP55_06890 [Deltaproteobacteria bacterium]|nr:hypothetical protein [Deltaproteobacteria bacterium]
MPRDTARFAALIASASLTLVLASCAGNECTFNSQCGRRMYCSSGSCRQDCVADRDCTDERVCSEVGQCVVAGDAGQTMTDSGPVDSGRPPVDSGRPPVDSGRPPPVDSGRPPPVDSGRPPVDSGRPPPVDSGTPRGTGAYFDRCTSDGDCATGVCVTDVGGARICTRSCTVHSNCAQGHVCAGGRCVRNDTGTTCSVASPASCALGLCLGAAGGAGTCTRDCISAIDCPSGYACTSLSAGGPKVCVDIEKPCTAGGSECATGLCLSGQGCTASCDSASDCPNRLTSIGLPAYQCGAIAGVSGNICLPPPDVLGADAIGASCPITGTIVCRSGICNTLPPPLPGAMCTQVCDPVGGCAPSLGCFPIANSGSFVLLCSRAGSGAIGDACSNGRDCDSALCDGTSNRCTRICEDGICPTSWRCERVAVPGAPAICRP